MGGKGTHINVPAPPDVGESTAAALEAQIAAIPEIYKAQLEWQPQILGQQIEAAKQYAPEMAELYTSLQEKYRNRLNPGWYETYKGVTDRVQEGLGQAGEIPEDLRKAYEEQIRAAQSVRGNAYSPISASSESQQLAALSEQARQQRLAQAAAVLGIAMPVAQVGTQTPNNTISNYTGSDLNSLVNNIYGGYNTYANNSVQAQIANQQNQFGLGDIFGSLMGAGGAAGGFGNLFGW